MKIEVKEIPAELTWPLRHLVLRSHQPFEKVKYTEDHFDTTKHFGAYVENVLVAVLSIYPEALPPRNDVPLEYPQKIGWRLRGMAVHPDYQRQSIGATGLKTCYAYLLQQNIAPAGIWCNARSPAVPYYEKLGFVRIGEEFEMPEIGMHYVMVNVNPANAEGLYHI